MTLCNYDGTQTTRIAQGTILIRAGPEIAVAASKTFACSLTALYVLALYLGSKRGTLDNDALQGLISELARLPEMLGVLVSEHEPYERLAQQFGGYSNFLYLGRGINYPLAMEGALKLKEISYIHAEGCQAGEMKHGPISLIDDRMPVVALAPQDQLHEKMMNNVSEAKTRGGRVLAVATEGDTHISAIADQVIYIPKASSMVSPILMAVPMQLLAYYIAVRRVATWTSRGTSPSRSPSSREPVASPRPREALKPPPPHVQNTQTPVQICVALCTIASGKLG